ncbi:hypothetical protein OEIGOIKO_04942 [Streptomyces chrestomyceticus JCM 4735]|uniref:Uncharacterized protein n=1 Tax=Streptomyces chrestomyceticus JCM 4735 TaxID=1306181 RepID=A0A7U9KZ10_9ACTN|nr:hypothetical protein [Streptomyces chrestomyceticus]GCD37158.1 hypothetical protein OEIGOIKO_04942 [Streptomyces chrestomyceticus JCM 4735]
MNHRQGTGSGPAYLSRTWLLVWFVLQWPVLPCALVLLVVWYVCLFLANAVVETEPRLAYMAPLYLGPKRLAREWNRDPDRWEDHFRALLPKLRKEATRIKSSPGRRVEYPLSGRFKYQIRHIPAKHGKHPDVSFTVPPQHYRGCGPEAARRIARADGWRIIAPGSSTGNGLAPDDRHGILLAIPDPRKNPTPPPSTPSGRP